VTVKSSILISGRTVLPRQFLSGRTGPAEQRVLPTVAEFFSDQHGGNVINLLFYEYLSNRLKKLGALLVQKVAKFQCQLTLYSQSAVDNISIFTEERAENSKGEFKIEMIASMLPFPRP
jgi:hypothetical protein